MPTPRNKGFTLIELLIVLSILAVVAIGATVLVSGPSSEETVEKALKVNGFTKGEVVGKNYLFFTGCGENETGYDVSALNSRNARVDLVVCVPRMSFKGATVRAR